VMVSGLAVRMVWRDGRSSPLRASMAIFHNPAIENLSKI
jgi:hypothetical protein